MEENKLQLKTPFGITFAQDFITEDLSELKKNKIICKGVKSRIKLLNIW